MAKHLYRKGLRKQDVRLLFRTISWLTRMPADLELKFREELVTYEQTEKPMTIDTFLSPVEIILCDQYEQEVRQKGLQEGRQEGRQEGLLQGHALGVLDVLEMRFGSVPEAVRARVLGQTDEARLRQAHRSAVVCIGLEDFLAKL